MLHKFLGLTSEKSLFLKVGDQRIDAEFEAGREEADKISSVHYIRFPMSAEQKAAFCDESLGAQLKIDYKDYIHAENIPAESRTSLISDLK